MGRGEPCCGGEGLSVRLALPLPPVEPASLPPRRIAWRKEQRGPTKFIDDVAIGLDTGRLLLYTTPVPKSSSQNTKT